jgi:hypothetical protein
VVVPFLVLMLVLVLVCRAPPMVSSELDSTRPSGWWMVVVVRDTVCTSVCVYVWIVCVYVWIVCV